MTFVAPLRAEPPQQLLPGLPAAAYNSSDLLENPALDDLFWHQKKRYIREFGFCLVTAEALILLAEYLAGKKVLEAGSGSGWLASELSLRGVDIIAADWTDYRQPPAEAGHGYPMRSVYRLDHHGDATKLLPGAFDVVMLVWPNLNTPFAENVAKAMSSGQIMIYEGEGVGGCNAIDAFFDVLAAEFEPLANETKALNECHRTFPGLHDHWQILRKK
ncbi:hypothetical protein [Propionivibrio sp.]|uniref:hypothetical protein n=1 Tax=Propionivibrio sp. TaxID=2212460 RepID=UPI003BEFF681